ncbi:bifunctional adenosylcobinamide kinase/adenosylcobinamide-phosphate guanylyltransferase [Halobacillus hunanensis]|uniref:bifunctional adenosylcobinamide kinase/adenosylcobinamide-phosphate guanylyltransferase n=1 Tax=Halobacillus hunanensis TaxID=578214 RepID=UPI0009A7C778|nr:bifunctional adenosylcobinamide kinase/adenosylcobinamide-phosphate guanylyltransferase [Halobacillus hunanensis]
MDFVTGGAYNGKLDWAIENYDSDYTILKEGQILGTVGTHLLIVNNLEVMFYKDCMKPEKVADQRWEEFYHSLMGWERADPARQLVMIGTDITGGIVPVQQRDRLWRDRTGFIYQQITNDAQRIFRLWFGISEQLK